MQDAVYSFEDTGENLSLLPLAARRALDVAGFRLSLEGYQSLSLEDRLDLTLAGTKDPIDTRHVESLVRLSSVPATRIKPAQDPDADAPPEQLGPGRKGRSIPPAEWQKLRAVDRYALVHTMRRSIAREDPERLELAIQVILGVGQSEKPAAQKARARARTEPPLAEPFDSDPLLLVQKEEAVSSGSSRPLRRSAIPDMQAVRGAPAVLGGPRVRDVEPSQPPRSGRSRLSSSPPAPMRAVPDRTGERRSSFPPAKSSRAAEAAYDRLERGLERLSPFEDAEGRTTDVGDPPELSSHLNEQGEMRMVDVGAKERTDRRASASGLVRMRLETAHRLARNDVPKGEVLATARLAGIMAAKKTPDLIPLCHAVALTKVDVHIDVERSTGIVTVTAVAEATDRTGVEMEALTAVSVACLTIYDMLKGIDRDMVIDEVKLLSKRGGKRGTYERQD